MKKSILLTVLLVGAGVATSQAGVAFGINIDNGRGYWSGGYINDGCAQPSYGYAYGSSYGYNGQYRYNNGYSYAPSVGSAYGYYGHRDLHHDLKHEHRDLHRDLNAEHRDAHRELRHEAAHGVPSWELRRQHQAVHHELGHEHQDAHQILRQQHREGHFELGW